MARTCLAQLTTYVLCFSSICVVFWEMRLVHVHCSKPPSMIDFCSCQIYILVFEAKGVIAFTVVFKSLLMNYARLCTAANHHSQKLAFNVIHKNVCNALTVCRCNFIENMLRSLCIMCLWNE